MNITRSHLLLPGLSSLAMLSLALMPGGTASASSASGADDYLAVTGSVPPNILYVIDLSEDMDEPCDGGSTGDPCIEVIAEVLSVMVQHYDWARYGAVGTTSSETDNGYYEIVPLGAPYAEFSDAMSSLTTHGSGVTTRNLTEVLASVSSDYLTDTTVEDDVDDDGDGYTTDWTEGPINYACQDTHVIVITKGRGIHDDSVVSEYTPDINALYGYTDIECDTSGEGSASDTLCLYDNAVWRMYNKDYRTDLSDDQIVTVHTLGFNTDDDSAADNLFTNASDLISGAGIYDVLNGDRDEFLASLMEIMMDVRAGFYSASTPVVSTNGDYLIYSYFEITGGEPLAEGHVRAYEIDTDPSSSTYGQVLYDGDADYGGALWDGGDLLVSRIVTASESNEEDRDGIGRRDIYTFFEDGVSAMYSESVNDKRQGFDLDFVTDIGADSAALDLILDTTPDPDDASCADDQSYDLNDDCQVDDQDLQALVDFVRGLNEAEFRYLDQERGTWRLGDSPNAIPVVVEVDSDVYAINPVYRTFLQELQVNDYPGIVLTPANDGMLHAFRLEENDDTSDSEIGEELWAWIPGYLLYREHDAEWAGRLIDLMLYGRTFLFDGTPVVEDVWIDYDGDGAQSCNSVPEDCEWRRIVVVQQGMGGPVTLALDITDPTTPEFLWEQTDESDTTAMGYTIGRPLIGLILDDSDSDLTDRYVAMWGSGRAVPVSTATNYYETAEANLYMWAVGDDYWGTTSADIQNDDGYGTADGDNDHPEASIVPGNALWKDQDSDKSYEYGYIAAALAGVDADDDGDMDTLYFPVSTSYAPLDEGGTGPGDISDPGSTWMYKACINTSDPGDMEWIEFFDPINDGSLLYRPDVYYAATTSWLDDGSLGVYWGSGSPYDRDSGKQGYFFAMKDTDPLSCASDTMDAISDCGGTGIYSLEVSEGLTSDPVAYAGVVYFSTWVPEADRCDGGDGRLYGIRFDDCSPGMDTDGSGEADSADSDYQEFEGERVSGIAVGKTGTLYVGTSDGTDSGMTPIDAATDPYLGTANIAWMEIF
jgi:hypothetical protein